MPYLRAEPDLLGAFRAGRPEALTRVYRAYVQRVERHLRELARAEGAAELRQPSAIADLLQEVFLRAFSPSARMAYDGLRDYGPYLGAIARNCFIDALRARGREKLGPTAEDPEWRDTEDPAAPTDLAEPKVLSVLDAYLASLSAELRSVCEHRFVLDRSQDEVVAALGISRRRLRTAEAKLRTGLRKALARAGISLDELGTHERPLSSTPPARAGVSGGRPP